MSDATEVQARQEMLERLAAAEEKPAVELAGQDGNAFAVMGRCRRAAKAAGWSDAEWGAVQTEMTSGDYDHLLVTACRYLDVR